MSGFVGSIDGTRIAYERVGSGPPVIALHGGLGTAASWRPVAERLADNFEFWLPDRRGRGASDPGTQPHSLEQEVDDTIALLDAAGASAALVGHSYGGAIALEAALRLGRSRVTAVAVYEPAVAIAGAISAADIAEVEHLIECGAPEAALNAGIALLDKAGLVAASPLPANARRPASLVTMAWTVPRELRAAARLGSTLDRYRDINVPSLVLTGTASPPRQQETCRRLANLLEGEHIAELHDLGHVAHTTAPDVVAGTLGAFLSD